MRKFIWFFALVLSSCSVAEERRDWGFIQSVGGLVVGGQDKNPNWLILRGDVSGLYEFTTKPTQLNSALALKSVNASITENAINVYVTTTVISKKYNATKIEGVNISSAKSGTYTVQYINKDGSVVKVGNVTIYR